MPTADMYRENILDHYKRPHHRGKLAKPDSEGYDTNPLCGDEVRIYLQLKDGKVQDIKFEATACAICTASASMLTDEVIDKPLEHARAYKKEELLATIGIDPGPARLKCALLPLKVLKLAVYKYLGKKITEEDEKLA